MKLRDDKTCHCPYKHIEGRDPVLCQAGYCNVYLCDRCGHALFDVGPIDCPHKKNENGTLRSYKYPDMDKKKTHWGPEGQRRKRAWRRVR